MRGLARRVNPAMRPAQVGRERLILMLFQRLGRIAALSRPAGSAWESH